jgi:hypothetical protein
MVFHVESEINVPSVNCGSAHQKCITPVVERPFAQLKKDVMDDDRSDSIFLAAGPFPKRDRFPFADEKVFLCTVGNAFRKRGSAPSRDILDLRHLRRRSAITSSTVSPSRSGAT